MKARSWLLARRRQAISWVLLLSLVLAAVTAHSRAPMLSVLQQIAGLEAVHGAEPAAILTSSGKFLRAPDLRQSGDPVDVAVASAPPLPAPNLFFTTALWAQDVSEALDAYSRPEPRAPPLA